MTLVSSCSAASIEEDRINIANWEKMTIRINFFKFIDTSKEILLYLYKVSLGINGRINPFVLIACRTGGTIAQ
jgi:hypothetical protein